MASSDSSQDDTWYWISIGKIKFLATKDIDAKKINLSEKISSSRKKANEDNDKLTELENDLRNVTLKIRELSDDESSLREGKGRIEVSLESNKERLLDIIDLIEKEHKQNSSNFIEKLDEFPVVLGSRYIGGGQCLMAGRRLMLSKYGNLTIKFVFQVDCNEFTTSYRGFNLKKLNNFHLNLIKTKGYSFFMGTIHEIFRQKIKVKEIPIIFNDRKKGYSKIPRIEILRTLINLFLLKFFK